VFVIWQTESLRLTAFLSASVDTIASSWWQTLLGEEPTRVSRPGGFLLDTGQFEGHQLSLSVQVGRIDWTLTPNRERATEGVPSLGAFPDSANKFRDLIGRWLEIAPPIVRLALGAVLVLPVSDVAEGHSHLKHFLPVAKAADLENSSNFSFAINRPMSSQLGISGLAINRYSHWSLATYRSIQVQLQVPPKSSPEANVTSTNLGIAVRAELDLSTNENFGGALPKDRLYDILESLLAHGKEISEKGDVK
jgi:hypothetical protein